MKRGNFSNESRLVELSFSLPIFMERDRNNGEVLGVEGDGVEIDLHNFAERYESVPDVPILKGVNGFSDSIVRIVRCGGEKVGRIFMADLFVFRKTSAADRAEKCLVDFY